MIRKLIVFTSILIFSLFKVQAKSLELTLEQADNIFIKNNYLLLAAQFNIKANEALVLQSKLFSNPNLSADFNVYDPGNNKLFHVNQTGQKSFALEQLILLGGKRKTQIELAKGNAQLAQLEFQDLMRNLKYELHTSFWNIRQQQKIIDNHNVQLKLLDTLILMYEKQTENGNIAAKEVVRLKSVYFKINNAKSEVAATLNLEIAKIKTILGIEDDVHPKLELEEKLSLQQFDLNELTQLALINRPDYLSVQLNLELSLLNLKLQKKNVIPDVTLNMSYDQRGGAFVNQYNSGFSLPLPIWNRNQGNILAAKENQSMMQQLKLQKELEIKSEVVKAYNDWQRSVSEFKKYKQLYNVTFNEVYEGISENFKKRNVSLIEFVDFIESYNESIAEMQRIITQLALSQEVINYTISK